MISWGVRDMIGGLRSGRSLVWSRSPGRLNRARGRLEGMLGIWHLLGETARRLMTARPGYILLALSLYIASVFIVGARWRGFVRSVGGEVAVWRASLATLG